MAIKTNPTSRRIVRSYHFGLFVLFATNTAFSIIFAFASFFEKRSPMFVVSILAQSSLTPILINHSFSISLRLLVLLVLLVLPFIGVSNTLSKACVAGRIFLYSLFASSLLLPLVSHSFNLLTKTVSFF